MKVPAAARRRIDEPFAQHLEAEGLEFLQFTFRYFAPSFALMPSVMFLVLALAQAHSVNSGYAWLQLALADARSYVVFCWVGPVSLPHPGFFG